MFEFRSPLFSLARKQVCRLPQLPNMKEEIFLLTFTAEEWEEMEVNK